MLKNFIVGAMRGFILGIAISIILISCTTPPIRPEDSELIQMKNELMTIVEQHCSRNQYFLPKNFNVYFVDQKEFTASKPDRIVLGVTQSYGIGPIILRIDIKINRNEWMKAWEIDNKQLLAHELMHAIFSADHDLDDSSFMYELQYAMNSLEFYSQFTQYLDNRCKID